MTRASQGVGPRVWVAPEPLVGLDPDWPTVFLAGSIEQGRAVDWQTELIEALSGAAVHLINPRRVAWDASWPQDIEHAQFRQQVEWELEGLERADLVVFYFAPETQAPITLLELGLTVQKKRVVVCCPPGFWRKGNVDVVCRRYGAQQVGDLTGLCKAITSLSTR